MNKCRFDDAWDRVFSLESKITRKEQEQNVRQRKHAFDRVKPFGSTKMEEKTAQTYPERPATADQSQQSIVRDRRWSIHFIRRIGAAHLARPHSN